MRRTTVEFANLTREGIPIRVQGKIHKFTFHSGLCDIIVNKPDPTFEAYYSDFPIKHGLPFNKI